MISIDVFFWFMVGFFGLIGYFRGWQKEVIALAGLVASIAALQQFGFQIVSIITNLLTLDITSEAWLRQQFWIQTIFHLIISFFSFQVVARLADNVAGGKLGARLRATLEKGIIGAIIGGLNGYLVIGTIWSFLEYQLTDQGYLQIPANVPYVFNPEYIARPMESALTAWLPMALFGPTTWLLFFFIIFFIVIIALI
jgi:uncharacterized membrane protein required for colicin V production